jgi:hypothetical protein
MSDLQLTEIAKALVDHFGPQLAAERDEGRRLMADALHERLGIPKRESTRLIEALEHAGTIRWIEPRINTVRAVVPPGDIGYWQLEPE